MGSSWLSHAPRQPQCPAQWACVCALEREREKEKECESLFIFFPLRDFLKSRPTDGSRFHEWIEWRHIAQAADSVHLSLLLYPSRYLPSYILICLCLFHSNWLPSHCHYHCTYVTSTFFLLFINLFHWYSPMLTPFFLFLKALIWTDPILEPSSIYWSIYLSINVFV